MDVFTIIIMVLFVVWLIAAIVYVVRHKGACSGGCQNCAKCDPDYCAKCKEPMKDEKDAKKTIDHENIGKGQDVDGNHRE